MMKRFNSDAVEIRVRSADELIKAIKAEVRIPENEAQANVVIFCGMRVVESNIIPHGKAAMIDKSGKVIGIFDLYEN